MLILVVIFIFPLCHKAKRLFVNGALHGKTNQMPQNYSSWLAVDGYFDTRTTIGRGPNTWWKVDLGREGLIIGVRLSLGAIVFNGNQGIINITVVDTLEKSFLCTWINVSIKLVHEKAVAYCDEALQGRYVQLQMSLSGSRRSVFSCEHTMYLSEVDVMLGKKNHSSREGMLMIDKGFVMVYMYLRFLGEKALFSF